MIELNLPHPLPNETADYREARIKLLQLEIEQRALTEQISETRRALPKGGAIPTDYAFTGKSGPVKLSELFGDYDSLIVYSLMYGPDAKAPCPMCTPFLDTLNGAVPLITQRCALAIVMSGPLDKGVALAASRGWNNLQILSAAGTTYQADYLGQNAEGDQMPMCNVFGRSGGKIHHFWGTEMLYAKLQGQPRHLDTIWPLWNALDLLPEGRGADWYPNLNL